MLSRLRLETPMNTTEMYTQPVQTWTRFLTELFWSANKVLFTRAVQVDSAPAPKLQTTVPLPAAEAPAPKSAGPVRKSKVGAARKLKASAPRKGAVAVKRSKSRAK